MMTHRKTLLLLIVLFFVFWFVLPLVLPQAAPTVYMITYPARILGIYVHEMGHGLFTLLSLGNFLWFQMDTYGGVALTTGGLRFMTLAGGLLGPSLLGALLLQASTKLKDTRPALAVLGLYFSAGAWYIVKPLFLSSQTYPDLQNWHVGYLGALIIPVIMVLVTVKLFKSRDRIQRIYLQIFGIFMCYSGYSDTSYIFRYEQLPNGLYSDVRVLASTFWPSVETVPFFLFVITAVVISALNFGLMYWGIAGALKPGNREVLRHGPKGSD